MEDFLKIFELTTNSIKEYRKNLIESIKNKYTIDKFYELEKEVEKKFFDLKEKNIEVDKIKYDKEIFNDIIEAYKKDNIYLRSFINKMFLIDDVNKYIYIRRTEGSLEGLKEGKENLKIMMKIFGKQMIEPIYYFEYDYGFPNFNFSCYNIGSDEYRKKRIKMMYFDKNNEKNWYKIILP